MSVLRDDPYGLTLGEEVKAKIRARNIIGWGNYSDPNPTGGSIKTEPGMMAKPLKGANTSSTILHLTWSPPSETGGDLISEYEVYYKRSSSGNIDEIESYSLATLTTPTSIEVEINVSAEDTTVETRTYDARVRAKNIHGWGEFSEVASLLAAKVPDDISLAATLSYTSSTTVRISWSEPNNGGLTITETLVEVKDGSNTFVEINECSGTELIPLVNRYCDIDINTHLSSL
jgi:hypothetical protein